MQDWVATDTTPRPAPENGKNMAEAKKTAKATPAKREMRPATLLNHIERYCRDNELGQDDTIKMLIEQVEQDIIAEAKAGS